MAVHDSRTNLPLAWAEVDVLELGMGAPSISPGTLTLVPNPSLPQNSPRVSEQL